MCTYIKQLLTSSLEMGAGSLTVGVENIYGRTRSVLQWMTLRRSCEVIFRLILKIYLHIKCIGRHFGQEEFLDNMATHSHVVLA